MSDIVWTFIVMALLFGWAASLGYSHQVSRQPPERDEKWQK